jgi:transposase
MLTTEERGELEKIALNPRTGQKVALRARIILLGAEGMPNAQIANRLRVSRPTVILQRQRFGRLGWRALLKDSSRRPGRARVADALVQNIVDATRTMAPAGSTQWTARSMAKWAGTSRMVVHRIWKRHPLQPHRMDTFKVSKDPQLAEKVRDVVGLYLDPPDRALVLSVDEKTSIQALDRTQPGLPIKAGRCATKTHDYKRNGTATLYAGHSTCSMAR